MTLVDGDYTFIWVYVGQPGSAGDAQVFNRSELKECIEDGSAGFLAPDPLPGDDTDVAYFIAADDAFALTTWLMKLYFLTVAGGFLVLDIVTFLRFFCRCCVGDGDGDLRSGEDFLRGGGVGSRIDSSSDVERMVPSSAFFITLFLTGGSFFVLGIFKMLQLIR